MLEMLHRLMCGSDMVQKSSAVKALAHIAVNEHMRPLISGRDIMEHPVEIG